MPPRARPLATAASRAALTVALALFALPGQAQFKVIGADGKVTYTDREPSASEGKVVPLGSRGAVAPPASETDLPFDLRQATARYPVTLYVASGACEPCNAGRQMLKQRGIPFTEKFVDTPEDSDALERLSGGREAPTLGIGAKILRGYSVESWTATLDAAGYPRESRLPSGYQYRAASPVVERREATATRVEPRVETRTQAPAPAPAPSGIRF